jgi:hypothetical protein
VREVTPRAFSARNATSGQLGAEPAPPVLGRDRDATDPAGPGEGDAGGHPDDGPGPGGDEDLATEPPQEVQVVDEIGTEAHGGVDLGDGVQVVAGRPDLVPRLPPTSPRTTA